MKSFETKIRLVVVNGPPPHQSRYYFDCYSDDFGRLHYSLYTPRSQTPYSQGTLQLKHDLPDSVFVYADSKALMADLISVIEGGVYRVETIKHRLTKKRDYELDKEDCLV